MSIGGRNLIHQNNDLTGYENLIGAVIREGMGWTNRWPIRCLDGKRWKVRKILLPRPMFTRIEWIKSECGRWWAGLGNLDPWYIYEQTGGDMWSEEECPGRSHGLLR
ncbi:MAG: hypothetical protein J3T61_03235 [Candidatus Brocadiales bacterium]|nr:hypothetical protein [Candidatus Bathyanammoxibius sp.]